MMPSAASNFRTLTLYDQTAVVTGAGSAEGIGFAIARRLYAAGVRVVIASTADRIHARARELDAGGEGVLSFFADLTVETEVQRFVDSVLSRAGRIDILVNNAGMAQTGRPANGKLLIATSFAEWQNQIAITLHTAFRMTRAVLPAMTQQKYGRMVNVTSVTGRWSAPGLCGVWRGEGADGRHDARRGDRNGRRRNHDQWRRSRLDRNGIFNRVRKNCRASYAARPCRHA